KYGWVPTSEQGGNGEHSWTWLEVVEAEKHAKPVLAFLVDEGVPWRPQLIDPPPNSERLARFKVYLESRYTYARFATPDDLATQVVASLERLSKSLRAESR